MDAVVLWIAFAEAGDVLQAVSPEKLEVAPAGHEGACPDPDAHQGLLADLFALLVPGMTGVEEGHEIDADTRPDALVDGQTELGGADQPVVTYKLVLAIARTV